MKRDGGPIFHGELSVRDYFASCALQGMIVADAHDKTTAESLASEAYEIADAMLKERTK